MKKIIITFALMVMMFAMTSVMVQAVTYEGLDMTYNEETGELYITGSGVVTREAIRTAMGETSSLDDKVESELKSVVIEGDVSKIDAYAFKDTNIEKAVLNDGLLEISNGAFWGCGRLSEIIIPDTVENTDWSSFYLTPWFNNQLRPLYAGKVLLDCKGTEETEIVIKDGTVRIVKEAFKMCRKIKSVYMPDSVTEMGYGVFSNCTDLEYVRLSENLSVLPSSTFSYCKSLGNIEFPEGIKEFEWAFDNMLWYDNLKETTVINGTVVKLVPDENGLAKVPDGAEHIMDGICKANEDIREVYIPSSIKTIGKSAFSGDGSINPTRIEKVTFEDAVFDGLELEEFAFRWCCNLKSVELPAGTKILGHGAFLFSGLESITIPDGVEKIGDAAFEDTKVTEIIVPDTVMSLGNRVVNDMYHEVHIYVPSTVSDISPSAFKGTKVTVHTPKNSVAYGIAAKCDASIVETEENLVGKVYDKLISTDVITTMNGNKINAYSIDGQTIILMRDLEGIGFDVSFDEKNRVASASFNPNKSLDIANMVSLPDDKVIYTDITVKINDVELVGYNIGGYMAVVAEDMGRYIPNISCTWVQSEHTLKMTASEDIATLDYFIDELARVKGYESKDTSKNFADARSPYTDTLVEKEIIKTSEYNGILYPDSGLTVYMFATYTGRAVYGLEYEKMAWHKECYTVPEIDYTNIPIYVQSYITRLYEAGIFAIENINGVNTIDVNRVMTKAEVSAALEKLIANSQ